MTDCPEPITEGLDSPGALDRRRVALPYRLLGLISLILIGLEVRFFLWNLTTERISPRLADQDFANYWGAARLAADGRIASIFGPQPRYFAELTALLRTDIPWHNWSYPPHYLLLMMPLALVGYRVGILLFLGVTSILFWTGLTAFMGRRDWLAVAAVAPLAVFNVLVVQNGFLTSGLILWFLALREKRPILAGMCLGAMTIKPQLAVLLPILPLIERGWMVLLSSAVTTAALILVSACAFGIGAWTGFVRDVLPYQAWIMTNLDGPWLTMVPSVFGAVRLAGGDAATALLAHASVAGPVLVVTIFCLIVGRRQRRADSLLPIALFLTIPYTLSYDLGVVGAALALFIRLEEAAGRSFTIGQTGLFVLAMALPLAMTRIGQTRIDIAPFVLLGVFGLMVRRTLVSTGEWSRLRLWLALSGRSCPPACACRLP